MIEHIEEQGQLYAIIIRNEFREPGVKFVTPEKLSQQLAYMQHPKGKRIQPHHHNPVPREIAYTFETLFVRKGKLRVDFYNNEQCYLHSRILAAGDAILLAMGGHGFEILEDLEMFEVKQGPFAGELDKTRFESQPHTSFNILP